MSTFYGLVNSEIMMLALPKFFSSYFHPEQLVGNMYEAQQSSETEPLVIERNHAGGVIELQLNRPKYLNAFNSTLYLETAAAIKKHDNDVKTRIIVLTSSGRCFTSGMDIREASQSEQFDRLIKAARTFMETLMNCSCLVVAAAFGKVTGIGVTLLMHCDAVLANTSSQFQTPFASIGVVPEFASSVLFPLFLGPSLTNRLLLRGEIVGAHAMQHMGYLQLVDTDVCSAAIDYAISWSRALDADQWMAIQESKRIIRDPIRTKALSAMDTEFKSIDKMYQSGVLKRLLISKSNDLTSRRAKL